MTHFVGDSCPGQHREDARILSKDDEARVRFQARCSEGYPADDHRIPELMELTAATAVELERQKMSEWLDAPCTEDHTGQSFPRSECEPCVYELAFGLRESKAQWKHA